MKKVLFISATWLPQCDPWTIRLAKFCKYLPEHGWKPLILTMKNLSVTRYDDSIMGELPKDLKIYESFRIPTMWMPAMWRSKLLIPDPRIAWLPSAVLKGIRVVKNERVDVIYSSCDPFSSHLIGHLVKKFTGVRWVAEFADWWTDNCYIDYSSKTKESIEKRMERRVIEYSDRVVTIMDEMIERFGEKYPYINKEKYTTITNGFDSEDYKDLKPSKRDVFTITYIGGIYGILTSENFLLGLRKLIDEKENLENKIRVRFVGKSGKVTKDLVSSLKLQRVVELIGNVEYKRSLEYQVNSHVLLLLFANEVDAKTAYPSKMVEYLRSKRPILALGGDGPAANLINAANAGMIVRFDDIEGIKQAIFNLYQKYEQNGLKVEENEGILERFERRRLTVQLAEVLEDVSGGKDV